MPKILLKKFFQVNETFENTFRHCCSKVVTAKATKNWLVSEPNFNYTTNFFSENYLGLTILGISKS